MPPAKSSNTSAAKAAEAVNKSFNTALQMMEKAGFRIRNNVRVSVDPQLPFMGYTMPQRQSFQIVVSGGAVGSGMLEGLLVHEMSHIYRIETKHPSHNAEILGEAVEKLKNKNLHYDYQQKILHDLLNDIQDLYADDIALQVFRATPTPLLDQITGFFQSMVMEKPARSADPVKDRWVNASIMVHNARAIAQMERHRIEDTGKRAGQSSQRFLARVPPSFGEKFELFRNRLAHLPEDITKDQYRALLEEHLNQFMELAEGR